MHEVKIAISEISEYEWPSFLYPQRTTFDLNDN